MPTPDPHEHPLRTSLGHEAWVGPFCPYIHGAHDGPRQHPWSMLQRRLTCWLVVHSADGEETIVVEGRPLHIAQGATYLIQPGHLHDLRSTGNRPCWIHFDLMFHPRRREHPYADAYQADLGPRRPWLQPDGAKVFGCDLPVLVPAALTAFAASTVQTIIQRWHSGTALGVLEAHHDLGRLMLAWAAEALESRGLAAAPGGIDRWARAEAVARARLDTGCGVEVMAQAAGLSRARFCAGYHAARGVPAGEFLRRERQRRAEDLLRRTDLPVARIGAMLGMPDPTAFGRFFRARTGSTPSAWRQAADKKQTTT
jgi:AraC-like DNA-binding protein